jgi:acetyltransferase-like isoleucine patch superfamily enzyme
MSATADALVSRVARLLRLNGAPIGWPVGRAIGVTRAKWSLRHYNPGPGVCVRGPLRLEIRGDLRIGARVNFAGKVVPTSFIVHAGGVLIVGDESVFNYGVSVESTSRVSIGRRCMFGSFVHIADRDALTEGPVTIGDDVWVAHGAIIGPGVTIGCGSVVGAGSVVIKDVPPQSMALGNPARTMSLSLWPGEPQSVKGIG